MRHVHYQSLVAAALMAATAHAQTPTPTATPQGTIISFCMSPTPGNDAQSASAHDTNYCPSVTPVVTPGIIVAQRSDTGGGNFVVGSGFFRFLTGPTLANKQINGVELSGDCVTVSIADTGDNSGNDSFNWTVATVKNCYDCQTPDDAPCGGLGFIFTGDFCGPDDTPDQPPVTGHHVRGLSNIGTTALVNVNTGDGYTALGFAMFCGGQGGGPGGTTCDGSENPPSGVNLEEYGNMCLKVWAVDVTPTPTVTATATATPPPLGCCSLPGDNMFNATCIDNFVAPGGLGFPITNQTDCDNAVGIVGGSPATFHSGAYCTVPGDITSACVGAATRNRLHVVAIQ